MATYEEAQNNFDQAMEDRLELERKIEEEEKALAEAKENELERIANLKESLKKKREDLVAAHRRVDQWNKALHEHDFR